MDRHRPTLTTLVGLVAFTAAPALADVQRTSFGVAAQVVGRATLEAVDVPSTITVSAGDLMSGYKDVEARYRLHTARLTQYVLTIAPRVGITESVEVRGFGSPVTIGSTDVALYRPAVAGAGELALRFRLQLRPGLAAGRYPLPVALSVSPP